MLSHNRQERRRRETACRGGRNSCFYLQPGKLPHIILQAIPFFLQTPLILRSYCNGHNCQGVSTGVLQGWRLQKEVRVCLVPNTAVPAGSATGKLDPPCTKADPGRGVSGASAETYLRKGDKCREKQHQSWKRRKKQ